MMKAFVCHASCTASHQFRPKSGLDGGCSSKCYCHSRPNKTKDWALVQNAALAMKIKVLKLGLVRLGHLT